MINKVTSDLVYNDFDSQSFGLNVYHSRIAENVDFKDWLDNIMSETQVLDVDLISVQSPFQIEHSDFSFTGKLNHFSCSFSEFAEHTLKHRNRTKVLEIGLEKWKEIEQLYEYSSPTRFSNEKRFDQATVKEHKIKMLSVYRQKYPQLTVGGFLDDQLIGTHFSSFSEEEAVYRPYEIIVHPKFRLGFLAIDLIAHNVRTVQENYDTSVVEVKAAIYETNKQSERLFVNLGLKYENSVYYYNYWKNK